MYSEGGKEFPGEEEMLLSSDFNFVAESEGGEFMYFLPDENKGGVNLAVFGGLFGFRKFGKC